MKPEQLAAAVKETYGLNSLHIFDEGAEWRVFGFRKETKGYQASVENGRGATIADALNDLSRRLAEGPIHRQASKEGGTP